MTQPETTSEARITAIEALYAYDPQNVPAAARAAAIMYRSTLAVPAQRIEMTVNPVGTVRHTVRGTAHKYETEISFKADPGIDWRQSSIVVKTSDGICYTPAVGWLTHGTLTEERSMNRPGDGQQMSQYKYRVESTHGWLSVNLI